MFIDAIIIVICYLIGNISTSILVGRVTKGIDIREHGSGNAGTTNVLRVIGKKAALATLIGDVLKGVIAVIIGKMVGGEVFGLVCGIAAIIGHIWPAIFGFRGGKGVATGLGVVATAMPLLGVICIAFGIIIIASTRYVSLGSILGSCLIPVVAFFLKPEFVILGGALSILVVFTHRANIKRLINKEESKVNFSK